MGTEVSTRLHLVRHPDDPWFDRVTVETEERWKESGLSGDEWRFSYVVTWWRKGYRQARRSYSRMPWALAALDTALDGMAPVGSDDDAEAPPEGWDELCFQPGCAERATVEMRLVKRGCGRCGQLRDAAGLDDGRRFCARHESRGDSNLDDMDSIYEVVRRRMPDGEWVAATLPLADD